MKIIVKTISVLMIWALFIGLSVPTFAQKPEKISSKTVVCDTIMVRGVCGSCEERIENAALIKGVKKVDWDKNTQQLIIYYKPSKVTTDKVEQEIAKVGHDTENYRAEDKIYNRLPACCAYRSGEIEIH